MAKQTMTYFSFIKGIQSINPQNGIDLYDFNRTEQFAAMYDILRMYAIRTKQGYPMIQHLSVASNSALRFSYDATTMDVSTFSQCVAERAQQPVTKVSYDVTGNLLNVSLL